ncbi:TPA: restriction endonuclease subunit S [Pasteurella multocida]|nr:restriction endonuclease subunit S [Pasteurella multocida]
MNNKKSSVPKLRFPEFTDAWEQRKLGKLADFNPRSNLPDEFKYVDLESVVGTELTGYRFENKLSAPSRAQRLAQKGDIFYQTVRPYQKNNYLFEFEDENFVFSTGYAQLRPLINGRFLFSKLQEDRFVQQVLDKCTGTSYPAINSSDLSEIKVYIPDNKQEQQKIGSFFTALDRLITTHQRKLENVKKLKKSLLQKMFPKNGQEFPEIRFPEFTDAWEQRKLGELATFSKGIGFSKSDLKSSGEPIILYGQLYTQYQTVINDVDTFVTSNKNSIFSEGDEVIVPASGETAEDIARASAVGKAGIILGGDLNIIKPYSDINSIFLALNISNGKTQKELSKKAQGKSVVHLRNDDLKTIALIYPIIQEQQKIGSFFTALDRLITTHQRKLENVKKLKKALLQQMFV